MKKPITDRKKREGRPARAFCANGKKKPGQVEKERVHASVSKMFWSRKVVKGRRGLGGSMTSWHGVSNHLRTKGGKMNLGAFT